ncbi:MULTISPECIES: molybdopterin-guanine dinucleotide biosynthesis protein B [Bacillaceae]|uniref:Molybdopterin-guanine dinucleotide biosynthesis protein MobB n=1 Tax=Domibacillus aminovorans TaxID=29332 RepID=A0A177KN38_9BACI|nr:MULTISPECIES: molybdopterin-guanine dinucleotide biosynthesis protein B [Bacillaceae]OAH54315.1 molybdopterin-guanine dinucleotide biosynthesis protein MobB [Domibacillus aminovorans]
MKNVLQVVGYQNSGKTTLITKLITHVTENGFRVASIKHHGHGGSPDTKDSTRHQQAGAIIAGVEGDGLLQLNIQRDSWPLDDILAVYNTFPVDLILVEGFKKELYPKIVLIRTEDDLPLLELEAIQCIISWIHLHESRYPVFRLQEEEQYLSFIIERLIKS